MASQCTSHPAAGHTLTRASDATAHDPGATPYGLRAGVVAYRTVEARQTPRKLHSPCKPPLLKAAGTVTGKLVRWPDSEGYIESDVVEIAADRAREGARDLPAAARLGSLLYEVAASAPEIGEVADEDWIEDQLAITEVEPGRIWFEGGVGPFEVPKQGSDLARPGWMVSVCAARLAGRWHLVEVGFVRP